MRRLMILAPLAILAACAGNDASTITGTSITNVPGTYDLIAVNGASLPIMVQAANPRIELIGERLDVKPGGTFTIATIRRNTSADGMVTVDTLTDAGTYGMNGSAMMFQFDSGNRVAASESGNALVLTARTSSSVYTR
jgi:hypothetical protein